MISAVIGFFFSSICYGQATANFTVSVTIIQPVGITTISNMNFARLDAKLGGEVILTPNGTRMTSGGMEVAEGGQVAAATFEVTGEAGFTFAITLPEDQYVLSNGSDQIIIRDFKSDVGGAAFPEEGSQRIYVGATLVVPSNQAPGTYRSQSPLIVTLNYN